MATASTFIVPALTISIVIVLGLLAASLWRRLSVARQVLADAEEQMAVERQVLQATLDHMRQGILILDSEDKVRNLNASALRLLDLTRGVNKRGLPRQLAEDTLCKTVCETLRHLASASSPRFEMRSPAGANALDTEVSPLPGGQRLITFTDISRERRVEAQIRHLASHDVLTGVPSRAVFICTLDEIIAARRTAGDAALLVIDLDRFAKINDAHGHGVGDAALQAVARRLRRLVRHEDVVGRLGSDSFAVIQRHILASTDAKALARRICEEIARPLEVNGVEISVQASIGIAVMDCAGATANSLLIGAGLALEKARASGDRKSVV